MTTPMTPTAKLAELREFRFRVSVNDRDQRGRTSIGFGFRFGYWPCLKAPYLQIAFACWRFDLWHGLPSYKYQNAALTRLGGGR